MKGTRAIVMLILSVVAGLAAVVLAARWLNAQAVAGGERVVVAARDVPLGTPLEPGMLQSVPWPSGGAPKGAFSDVRNLEGRVLRQDVLRGEPLLDVKLAPVGTRGGLSAVIPPGRRAITVKVNEVVGVAGFALPGNYVDVLVNTQDDKDRPISKIVLERILVLAIAQEATRDDTRPKVVNAVTLEVTPDQAERLDLARSVGNLSLVLRNQLDQAGYETDGIRKTELFGRNPSPPPQATAPRPRPAPAPAPAAPRVAVDDDKVRVEVIRGVQRSTAEL